MTDLIFHAANIDQQLPPSSLAGLERCLQTGVPNVEVDIIPLKDGDFALLHDPKLEHVSDVQGQVAELSAQELTLIKYKNTEYSLGTLSQAIDLLEQYSIEGFLQLDLKPFAPLTPACLRILVELINPVKQSILISSVADWAIRALHVMDPELMLGFDPLLYLDLVTKEPREEGVPPFRVGAFGYLDDHPLAVQRWGKTGEYFAARAESLLQQVPGGVTWFINAQLLLEAFEAGFNWPQFLHKNDHSIDAWTIDTDRTELALKVKNMGVDFITTNQYYELAKFLNLSHQ